MESVKGQRQREWRKKNPERAREYNREHYRQHKARYVQKPSRYHGLTLDQVLAALEAQGGGCKVCAVRESGGKGWHGDHDHATGAFRGVLCTKCNMGIGLLRDDPVLCRAAANYLERHAQLQAML